MPLSTRGASEDDQLLLGWRKGSTAGKRKGTTHWQMGIVYVAKQTQGRSKLRHSNRLHKMLNSLVIDFTGLHLLEASPLYPYPRLPRLQTPPPPPLLSLSLSLSLSLLSINLSDCFPPSTASPSPSLLLPCSAKKTNAKGLMGPFPALPHTLLVFHRCILNVLLSAPVLHSHAKLTAPEHAVAIAVCY